MKKIIETFMVGSLLLTSFSLNAQQLIGKEIVRKTNNVPVGETTKYTANITLTDKKGKIREREIDYFEKKFDAGQTTKSIVVFTTPKDVAGVSYLSFEYKETDDGKKKDSDDWLYMPAMKKVRRISGSNKTDDFMGTDFTYEDIGSRSILKDTFEVLGEETVNDRLCYKVECKAVDTTEKNPRRILYIDKENFMTQKGEYFDRQDILQRELICSDIKKINGYWTCLKMTMKNVQTEHETVLVVNNIQYNTDLKDSMFTVSSLERGSIK